MKWNSVTIATCASTQELGSALERDVRPHGMEVGGVADVFDGLRGRRQRVVFFFSSRRRHTRFDCDWSSDVCSSDLRQKGIEESRKSDARTEKGHAEKWTIRK